MMFPPLMPTIFGQIGMVASIGRKKHLPQLFLPDNLLTTFLHFHDNSFGRLYMLNVENNRGGMISIYQTSPGAGDHERRGL